jgi:hypothetical protein
VDTVTVRDGGLAAKLREHRVLCEALSLLAKVEQAYRETHDLHGDGSLECGRAWDVMRRAGDHARRTLAELSSSF